MKTTGFLLLILLTSSCALFKRNTKTTEQAISRLQRQETHSAQNDIRLGIRSVDSLAQSDSSKAEFEIILKPKGETTFTLDGGIKGDFETVTVKGVLHQQTKMNTKQIVERNLQDHSSKALNLQEQTVNDKKKSSSVSFYDGKWIFLLLLASAIGLYCHFRRVK